MANGLKKSSALNKHAHVGGKLSTFQSERATSHKTETITENTQNKQQKAHSETFQYSTMRT